MLWLFIGIYYRKRSVSCLTSFIKSILHYTIFFFSTVFTANTFHSISDVDFVAVIFILLITVDGVLVRVVIVIVAVIIVVDVVV